MVLWVCWQVLKDGSVMWAGGAQGGAWADFGPIMYPSRHADPTRLSLNSGWRAFGADFAEPQVFRYGKLCMLTGMVRSDHSDSQFWNVTIAQVPESCRPDGDLMFGVNHNDVTHTLRVGQSCCFRGFLIADVYYSNRCAPTALSLGFQETGCTPGSLWMESPILPVRDI